MLWIVRCKYCSLVHESKHLRENKRDWPCHVNHSIRQTQNSSTHHGSNIVECCIPPTSISIPCHWQPIVHIFDLAWMPLMFHITVTEIINLLFKSFFTEIKYWMQKARFVKGVTWNKLVAHSTNCYVVR